MNSHKVYDIVKGQYETVESPDILIVEGINVLQLPTNQQIYVSDFFDFSIYVDAEESLIEEWYLERFETLLQDLRLQERTSSLHVLASSIPHLTGDQNQLHAPQGW